MDTWIDDVELVLNQLGGKAHLSDINDRVRGLRDLSNNNHLEETVRATLNSNVGRFVSYGEGEWGNVTIKSPKTLADEARYKEKWKELNQQVLEINEARENLKKELIEKYGLQHFESLIQ